MAVLIITAALVFLVRRKRKQQGRGCSLLRIPPLGAAHNEDLQEKDGNHKVPVVELLQPGDRRELEASTQRQSLLHELPADAGAWDEPPSRPAEYNRQIS
jgi:hypothetical protein